MNITQTLALRSQHWFAWLRAGFLFSCASLSPSNMFQQAHPGPLQFVQPIWTNTSTKDQLGMFLSGKANVGNDISMTISAASFPRPWSWTVLIDPIQYRSLKLARKHVDKALWAGLRTQETHLRQLSIGEAQTYLKPPRRRSQQGASRASVTQEDAPPNLHPSSMCPLNVRAVPPCLGLPSPSKLFQ
ncbi:hypothetical protein CMEL01_06264 [Colletotrichum melonis]|uniref:Uncharacterized protein n=1 Tax=Colletotrichum melonis TaxID=1209925 RepID=A0AAI9XKV1_9PEZI|nr:hypothetical protein CMEL01_06264 [Colletotrichum melonis]